jgi:hypothetical protein
LEQVSAELGGRPANLAASVHAVSSAFVGGDLDPNHGRGGGAVGMRLGRHGCVFSLWSKLLT